jgi:hypothetical protein
LERRPEGDRAALLESGAAGKQASAEARGGGEHGHGGKHGRLLWPAAAGSGGEAEVEAEEEAAAEAEELLLGASEPMRPPLLLLLLAEGDNGTVPSIAVRSFTPRAQTDFGYLGQWEDSRWT